MNPLKRLQYNAPVTLTFALISLLVLGIAWLTNGESNRLLFSVYRAPFNDFLMYLRVFLHPLGHADMTHYISNFMIILLIGPMLEEKYGTKQIIQMMLITALITGVLHMIVSSNAKLGASGIVFMMILLGSFANMRRGRIPLTLIFAVCIFIGQEVVSAITLDNNIAYMSHIVGGICGAAFGFVAGRQRLDDRG